MNTITATIMSIIDDLFWRAALAALGVAIAAAPLGCFVVWRRMAYFTDATSHAAILGVAIALGFEVSVFVGVAGVALAVALAVWALSDRGVATDTALGVMSYSALSVGLVAVSLLPGVRVDLEAFLFGDVLAVARGDLAVIWGGAVIVVAMIGWRWSRLLTATLNPELAQAVGIAPRREGLILIVLLALVVAVAIKVVGALLIGALMIIPAAAARPMVNTPERMVGLALIFGALSALGGLQAAFVFDTPAGPTIVTVAAAIFALSNLAALGRK